MALRRLQLLVLLLQLFSNGISGELRDDEKEEEMQLLLSFKEGLQNPGVLSSWTPTSSHCEWKGVACVKGRVTSLVLSTQSLRGPLSPSLFSLSSLIELDLSSNFLHGGLPPGIAGLRRLKALDLGDNQFSGDLPSELGELTHLETLRLGPNSFAGKIPPELGNLFWLKSLDLSSNELAGNIPTRIENLTRLQFLGLGNNLLTGSLFPSLFSKLQSLITLDVSNNSLSGTIPPEIGNLKNLTDLYIGINLFSGELPPEIGALSSLQNFFSPSCSISGPLPETISDLKSLSKVDLSHNPLKCSITKSFGKLQNLTILNLVYADLNGSIPAELGNCRNLRTLMLSFNFLSGPLPEELRNLPMVSFSAERNQLSGPLPSWLGQWDLIDSILLSSNRFSGKIPPEIGNCTLLSHISLSSNLLTGPIPRELCNAVALTEIDFDSNYLSGSIEETFIMCTNLSQLVLVDNQIIGSIPEYLSDLPLMVLDVDSNNFTGSIPVSLWNSKNLMEFSAAFNLLEGNLPIEIGNALALERLVLNNNNFGGKIPSEIGNLRALSVLSLNSNFFEGTIPVELGNCIALTTLDLGNNRFNGSFPEELADLPQLQCLVLSHNNLSGPIPSKPSRYFREVDIPDSSFVQHHGVYDLSHNRFHGLIPDELGNCVVVVDLLINNNLLTGEIPASLARLRNLTTLDLSGNLLSGGVPAEFGDSLKLQGLYLGNNNLTGVIPSSLGQLSGLVKLNLTGNKLSGPIPLSFGNMDGLTHLDLSLNLLTGELPLSLSMMVNLVGLYVQQNRLSGRIVELFLDSTGWRIETVNLSSNFFNGNLPQSLGNMSYLTSLDLHGNMFTGEIPPELGNMMQLEYLDVSGNRLSGQIPEKICSLVNLFCLNLAENALEGPVPRNGICRNLSKVALHGNTDLCGGILGSECPIRRGRRGLQSNLWGLSVIVFGAILVTLSVAIVLRIWHSRSSREGDTSHAEESKPNSSVDHNLYFLSSSRSKEPLSINIAMFEMPLLKLTLVDILEATNNFCKTNIIGDGGFGTVYKATLSDGKIVAVKKLNQAKAEGHREFLAEMETLGKVKHPNLVPLLGYCSFGDEKLLVYEYMVNGSLDLWLRNRTEALEVLDWNKRFKIARGAACGLAFLHHGFIPHIIHRDIKASNILLSNEFDPKVADFGLARLISACETHVSTDIAGTFGYIPPEYGHSWRSTTKGDVYSFGVILLELVTGKEPTGPEFKEIEGGNLVGWVFQKIKKGEAVDVLDPMVLTEESKKMMLQTLQIAAICLSENPASRPTMLNVFKSLKGIRDYE
ncbi:leucine-rich repeat receptor protein kinase EMS1 [Diospyros lotus]|uniref:leucine-rich repeat receptor protein kinase EMS1 n=1 Tax=Diospyros lotus TaxID=55363 RepID=UPI002253BB6A|nr:leucine-rich repeat receptor protein kinase EMS1 [Diospyros lotus]